MKTTYVNIIAFSLCLVLLFGCEQTKVQIKSNHIPAPTNTVVKNNGEESDQNSLDRELWIESMHKTAPGQNWRQIEYANSRKKAQGFTNVRRTEQVILGDSLYQGYWLEKGSNNQAGSIVAVNYLQEQDLIYCISAGGTIWKGPRDGSDWQVVNESYKFDDHSLMFFDLGDGSNRMIATIARIPHYSDDYGLTWEASSGIISSADFWSRTYSFESVHLSDNSTRIYCISKFDYWSDIKIYYSDDLGKSYQELHNLRTNDFNSIAICKPHGSDEILVASKSPTNKFKLEKINHDLNSLDFLRNIDVNLGVDERIHLIGNYVGQDSVLYALEDEARLKVSKDAGMTWNSIADVNSRPWDIGFYVSPSNADQVFYGEVEAFRMDGDKFEVVNRWWEYYDDVLFKMHADIMSIKEFTDPDEIPFLLIGNHGGLSISYDYMLSNQNISLEGLNVAQYYDVRTDPTNPNYVYAGSQDQGFQRTNEMTEDGAAPFDQVISGDYGHLTFSKQGEGLWIGYPGGDISFYPDPKFGYATQYYVLNSPDESNWLTPMTDIPNSKDHEVLLAGGSIYGESGSHIIKLKYSPSEGINTEQFAFDFKLNSANGTITAIEVSPINQDIIYVSTSDGSFFTSQDGGVSFEIGYNAINNGHYLYGTSIYSSRVNENEVWIAGSGYNNDGVFYSNDYGKNFSLFSDGLPSTLVFELTANADETQFYAATESGPYAYFAETGKWEDLSQGNAPVHTYWSVEYLQDQDIVRFGTYGRGIWDFQFGELINVSTKDVTEYEFATLYPNPVSDILQIDFSDALDLSRAKIELYQIDGKLLQQSTAKSQLDMSMYPAGNYLLRIVDNNKLQVETVIKQ